MQHDDVSQRNLKDEHTESMTLEELQALANHYAEEADDIDMRLRIANERKGYGGRFDEEWFNRACAARAHIVRNREVVERALERMTGGVKTPKDVRAACILQLEGLLANYKGEVRRDTIQRCIDAVLDVAC